MKKILLSLVVASALFTACNNAGSKDNESTEQSTEAGTPDLQNAGVMDFKEKEFDFGTIKEGALVKHTFTFTNTGKSPIILAQVSASCGCTTPTYTSEPVLPGKTGEINVEFNSDNQVGQQQKIITIASNANPNILTVQLKGTVEPK